MSAPAPQTLTAPEYTAPLSNVVIALFLITSAVVATFAVSSQSFWLEEGQSLLSAMARSPYEAWYYAHAVGLPALHYPLYQIWLYLWHHLFGSSEWAMRASNIPWFLGAQLAFLLLLRHRPLLALSAATLAAVSPLLWNFLDEARPQLMGYAAACWLTAALIRLAPPGYTVNDPAPSLRYLPATIGAALVILFTYGLVGSLWAAGFLAVFLWIKNDRQPLTPRDLLLPAVYLPLAAAALVGLWYLYTWPGIVDGHAGLKNFAQGLIYIAYDFFGFAGFGPGKIELRLSPRRAALASLPALLPLALVLGLLLLRGWKIFGPQLIAARRSLLPWALALAVPAIILLVILLLTGHRPLPRHFLPAFPALIAVLAALTAANLQRPQTLWRAVTILLPLLWLGSSINLRWRETHAKDDYRTAAAIARAALQENKEVWWAADAATGFIYLNAIAMEETPGRAWAMQGPDWDALRFKLPPRVIIISKPDIFDPRAAIARYAAENHFQPALQLQAFTIFTRPDDPLPAPAP